MPQDAKRRGKQKRLYEILVISIGEGERTRRFRVSRVTLALFGILFFLLCVGITLALLIFTPIAMYAPIPNPLLEKKYGRQIVETQQRLNALAEDVLLLRDYNNQLRKALGSDMRRDSAGIWNISPSVSFQGTAGGNAGQRREPAGGSHGTVAGDQEFMLPETGDLVPPGLASGMEAASPQLPLLLPTDGYLSQGFDPAQGHYGMDFAGKRGTPVYAAGDGIVVFSGWTYEDGNMVILAHGGGYMTVYKHTQVVLKGGRGQVRRGEAIALLGTSGKTSLGPHLHFEVWKDGSPQDPNQYLLRPARTQ